MRYRERLAGWTTAGLLTILAAFGVFDNAEAWTQDLRFRLRGPRSTHSHIVLAEIRDSTLSAWPEPKVAWGYHYARMVRQALKGGAQAVGFDVIPAVDMDSYLESVRAQQRTTPDLAFAEAIEWSRGRVVLSDDPHAESGLLPRLRFVPGMEFNTGYVDVPPQTDSVVRTLSAWRQDAAGHKRPSFAAALACHGEEINTAAGREDWLPADALFRVNYVGRRFPVLAAETLAGGQLTPEQRRELNGALVIVAPAFTGSNDVYREPDGAAVTGGEINAQASATLIDHRPLVRIPWGFEIGCTLLLCLCSVQASIRASSARWLYPLIVATVCWLVTAQLAFARADIALPTVAPLLGLSVPALVQSTAGAVDARRRRREIEAIFGQYVSPEISRWLLRSEMHRLPGGQTSDATVLFLDVREFTRFAQSRAPDEVLQELNALFREIVPLIDQQKGLLFKYTGDGLLAVFGVPLPLERHAQAAYDTAVAICDRMREINLGRLQRQLAPWRIGIGIHTGEVVYGNLGFAHRTEFTVIGDTVNIAARLEETNKMFSSSVVLSEEVHQRILVSQNVQGPVTVQVRGRTGSTSLYFVAEEPCIHVEREDHKVDGE